MDNAIYETVANSLNLPVEVVKLAYTSYWKFIRTTIELLPLKNTTLSEEEFNLLRTNFNIPSLGKLNCTYEKYDGINRRFKYIRDLKERK